MADPNLYVLRPVTPDGARPPLFLVGVAGVNALGFVALARWLPAAQPVTVVQPTRKGRKFPPEGIGPGGRDEYPLVAAEYVASIRTVQPHGPYFLAGSCDGALVAFEMARLLEAEGQRVGLLAILDTWPLENTSVHALVMLKVWRRSWQEKGPAQRRALVRRKATEVIGRGTALLRLRETAQEQRPAPPPVATGESGPSLLTGAARRGVWRARLWPGPGFRPPVIQAPLAVLRVAEQPYWRIHDDALGWRGRTRGVVTVHILPGDHLNWARAPHVALFARTLGAYLDTTPPASPDRASLPPPAPIANTEALPPRWERVVAALKGGARALLASFQRGP